MPADLPTVIVERKIKPDGTVREYACELVTRAPGVMVVRFRMPDGGAAFGSPVAIPPGTVSLGWFWTRRPHNLYRMFRADGTLVAHRFDAVADVKLLDGAVEYRDLVLDWWVMPDDTIVEEDRDELELLVANGIMGPRDAKAANAAAYEVLSRYRHIIDEVTALERKLGVRPGC